MIAKTNDPPEFDCPKCGSHLEITFQGLESQSKIIRKGQCTNITCGGRIWSWAKAAKPCTGFRQVDMTCPQCQKPTGTLSTSRRGLVCPRCYEENRNED